MLSQKCKKHRGWFSYKSSGNGLARQMHIRGRMPRKEAGKMEKLSKKFTYIGAGIGLVLFALVGLLPGSLLGGAMGLNIVGTLFGYPVTAGVLQRMIVAASMLVGVMVAGIIFVVGCSVAGWLVGTAADAIMAPRKAHGTKAKIGTK
jgi:hypothetical protein